jgi:hypothetical protein
MCGDVTRFSRSIVASRHGPFAIVGSEISLSQEMRSPQGNNCLSRAVYRITEATLAQ